MESTDNQATAGTGHFLFVGEHPALDFANTLLATGGRPVELLRAGDDLLEWLVAAQLISQPEKRLLADGLKSEEKQQALLNQIRVLRDLWKTNLKCLIEGKGLTKEFLQRINELLREDHTWLVLSQDVEKRTFRIHSEHVPLKPAKAIPALIASQVAHFLSTANPNYLRRCAGVDCVMFFYDTTKSHRRQWCSMAICGNRHKVAKFRAKEKAAP